MNLRILMALLRKELKTIRHNSLVTRMIVAMPVMVMLVMPLIATLDVSNVGVAVVDLDRSQLSRRIISDISATGTLHVEAVCAGHEEAMREIESGRCDVILTIPYRFASRLSGLDVEANGVNATKGMLGARYVSSSAVETIGRWLSENGRSATTAPRSVINRYNPTLNYRNFMIPALMVVLIIVICGFLPALNLVSEKEYGTIEAINVTPVGKFTFVLSKLLPFWVIGIFVVAVGMLIGWSVYGLAPAGSIWAILLAAVLFSLVMSGIGVTVANSSDTMLQSIFMMFAIIMIFQLMGGLFTPVSSMPEWARWITYAVPPRYFIEIMRSVYLKGTGVAELGFQYAALGGMALALCLLAALTYRKQS